MDKICALILAAGKGTRMHSPTPKVLHKLLGEPMLGLVHHNLEPLFGQNIYVLCGHGSQAVQKAYPAYQFILQTEQLGTAHAVQTALPKIVEAGFKQILVINGDAPLISTELIEQFIHKAASTDVAFATVKLDDPQAYGRVVRQGEKLVAIVEAKNYDQAKYGSPSGEINTGLYLLKTEVVSKLLPQIAKNELSGEYYLTDLVAIALAANYNVQAIESGSDAHLLGINTPKELLELEEILRAEIVANLISHGALLHSADLLRISPQSTVEPGAEITGPCEIYGASYISSGAEIESHCVLKDSTVAGGALIHSFSHLDHANVGQDCLVGPYARLRPGAILEEASHVGNFVELKKTRLGQGAKANHLTYLGDAKIGAHTNIGAGTITCNYDGFNKFPTEIGENAFIGSNTALVAPVKVGANALIGAGSTITHDVPESNLAISRSKQKNYPHKPFPREPETKD